MNDLQLDLRRSITMDNGLEAKLKAMSVYFLDQIPERNFGIKVFKQGLHYKLTVVDKLWSLCNMGYRDCFDFLSGIDLLMKFLLYEK
jgi:hypothetical protein